MLTFRAVLDAETEPARRRILLAGKVEDMLNTVVRQVAFYQFEQRVLHDAPHEGELLPERIGEIWLEVQRDEPRPAFEFTSRIRSVLEPTCRTSCTRRSTSTPMRSATAW